MKTFKKVLLVDDDELTNLLNKKTIQRAGFAETVHEVINGQEALEYLNANKDDMPDLIFLDINMPIMNGFEFLDAYNETFAESSDTIILMMLTTSLSMDNQLKAKTEFDVSEYMHKPLTLEKLEQIQSKYVND